MAALIFMKDTPSGPHRSTLLTSQWVAPSHFRIARTVKKQTKPLKTEPVLVRQGHWCNRMAAQHTETKRIIVYQQLY